MKPRDGLLPRSKWPKPQGNLLPRAKAKLTVTDPIRVLIETQTGVEMATVALRVDRISSIPRVIARRGLPPIGPLAAALIEAAAGAAADMGDINRHPGQRGFIAPSVVELDCAGEHNQISDMKRSGILRNWTLGGMLAFGLVWVAGCVYPANYQEWQWKQWNPNYVPLPGAMER